jgi:hypothetical protein
MCTVSYIIVLEDLSTIVLLDLVFMCCAGYERCEGRLERHWKGVFGSLHGQLLREAFYSSKNVIMICRYSIVK